MKRLFLALLLLLSLCTFAGYGGFIPLIAYAGIFSLVAGVASGFDALFDGL